MIIHETERLLLTGWALDDFAPFAELARDPQVMRHIADGKPWPDSRIGWFLGLQHGYQQTLGYCCWKLVERETGAMIGFCGLAPHAPLGETEIGWWLKPSHWHRGFATEAARHVFAAALSQHGLTRLIARAYAENHASVRIIKKLGMTYERTLDTNDIGSVQLFGTARAPRD